MKIEMGESLGASWLKHVKGCDIVQTNWKVSPGANCKNFDKIQEILDELKVEFGESSIDIFGNEGPAQIVRQTECDVLGLDLCSDGRVNVNALEVAIHLKGDGLHYSGLKHANPTKRVNVSDDKVVAKLFGIAMTMFSSMDKVEGEISFASPIVRADLLANINSRLDLLKAILAKHGLNFVFRMYANQDFYLEIMRRVLAVANDVADTNELFLRAMQIYLASAERWTQERQSVEESENVGSSDSMPSKLSGPASCNGSNTTRGRSPKYNVVVNQEIYSAANPMGRAARDVVKAYIEHVPDVTFAQLRIAFPRTAHGYRDMVVVESDNLEMCRFSLPIMLADGTSVLVTNQWYGAGAHENWQHFCNHVAGLDRDGLSIRIELNDGDNA